jgi:hypothetical protein
LRARFLLRHDVRYEADVYREHGVSVFKDGEKMAKKHTIVQRGLDLRESKNLTFCVHQYIMIHWIEISSTPPFICQGRYGLVVPDQDYISTCLYYKIYLIIIF